MEKSFLCSNSAEIRICTFLPSSFYAIKLAPFFAIPLLQIWIVCSNCPWTQIFCCCSGWISCFFLFHLSSDFAPPSYRRCREEEGERKKFKIKTGELCAASNSKFRILFVSPSRISSRASPHFSPKHAMMLKPTFSAELDNMLLFIRNSQFYPGNPSLNFPHERRPCFSRSRSTKSSSGMNRRGAELEWNIKMQFARWLMGNIYASFPTKVWATVV